MGKLISPSKTVDMNLDEATDDDVIVVALADGTKVYLGTQPTGFGMSRQLVLIDEFIPDPLWDVAAIMAERSLRNSRANAAWFRVVYEVESIKGLTPELIADELMRYLLSHASIHGGQVSPQKPRRELNVGTNLGVTVFGFSTSDATAVGWNDSEDYEFDSPVSEIYESSLARELVNAAIRRCR